MVTEVSTIKYFYTIAGTIPELMPDCIYRRTSSTAQYNRKILKCPVCGKRLTDISIDTRVELYQHPVHVTVNCHFYIKCYFCQCEVGINIA